MTERSISRRERFTRGEMATPVRADVARTRVHCLGGCTAIGISLSGVTIGMYRVLRKTCEGGMETVYPGKRGLARSLRPWEPA